MTKSRCSPEVVIIGVAYIFDPGCRDGRETVRETSEHIACIPLRVPLRTEVALGAAGKLKAGGQGNVVTELPPCLTHQPDASRGVRVEFFRREGLASRLTSEVVDEFTREAAPQQHGDHAG